ncbi:MAG: nickel-dependent lactate racemase, partial [Burkholderiaceae bacterium]
MNTQATQADGGFAGSDRIELAFGQSGLWVDLPAGCSPTIIRKPVMPVTDDGASLIQQALAEPIGSLPLGTLARGAKTACILICDITRPVPNGLFLRPLIERLFNAGIPADGITVLVATGLHRPNLGAELEEVLGDPWVQQHVRVENHDARDESAQAMLGQTIKHQVPVGLNRRFVEADIKIATGLVEPHFMAGYSGGRKVIAPGVAHHKTIRTFHSARFMESEFATSCNLDNNPLHETQLEIVQMLDGPVLGLNTVLDEHRNLVFASFGEIIESHLAAVAYARRSCEVAVGRKFRTVVTSSAGYPLDKTYYQTVKGMVTPLDILEDGGELIIVSACSEGFGSPEFRAAQERLVSLGAGGFLQSIEQKHLADIDEWQTEMQLKPMRVGRIHLYSPGLDADDRHATGVEMVDNVAQAIAASIKRQG